MPWRMRSILRVESGAFDQAFSGDATCIAGVTYFGSADKARRELGWQPRRVEVRVRETMEAMSLMSLGK